MTRKALLWPNVLEIQINAFIQVKTLVVIGWLLPLWSREEGISYFNPALCLIQHRACYFYLELDLGFLSRLTSINQWLNLSRVLDAFSIVIRIRCELRFALIQASKKWSPQNFTDDMGNACHVRKYIAISISGMEWNSIEGGLWMEKCSWNGPHLDRRRSVRLPWTC